MQLSDRKVCSVGVCLPKTIEANFPSCYPILACSEGKAETLIDDQLEHHIYEAVLNPINIHVFPFDFLIIHQAQ
jgi:hypothetical protein